VASFVASHAVASCARGQQMNSLTCTVGLTAVGKHDLDHVDLHPLREGGTENYL
jgi:hypothetical protein